ncbi:autophagy-related protein 13 homolog isoform X1 [Halyomorpha halys]|uniref:autophagy-related protein 13 homolog isoform X1 n=1 Tax=Halyomorpha halys TaxID=286706 RepID=UPI0006D4D6CA|nr:autophagy-related protein 13 isoform X1 [Halyomorpha halys]
MSERTSADEAKDLDKFTKFLALKSAQIIVQSRLGEKVRTQCKPFCYSNKDWVSFYLAIDDLPDVLEKAKSAMCQAAPRTSPLPLCVEISLRTVEGDTMVLETWCIGVNPEVRDTSVRVAYTVYNRMGILLKSLVSVTRVTPAYKLSRRQCPDSYVISYRIYVGEPQYHLLGDGYNQARVGQLGTPGGTIHLTCYFRTKMTISPQPSKDNSIMLKSDHFRPDFSPKHDRTSFSDDNLSSLSETIKVGAFVESVSSKERTMSDNDDDVPFSNLLKQCSVVQKRPPTPPRPPTPVKKEDTDNGNVTTPRSLSHDDFIMVDLKTPFAGSNANTDLGVFYRECQSAPQLEGFSTEPTLAEQVGDLTEQLEQFEVSLKEYDNVITELCATDNNN